MPPLEEQQRLDRVHINDVPRNILYRVTRVPVIIDEKVLIRPGEHLIVSDDKAMPLQIQYFLDYTRQREPDAAYFVLEMHRAQTRRRVFAIIPACQDIHDGPGRSFTSCRDKPGAVEERARKNIAPSLITAEKVPSCSVEVQKLPRDTTLFFAKTYYRISSNGVTQLTPSPPDYQEPGVDNTLLASLFIMRGTPFTLEDKDGKLVVVRGGTENRDAFTVDPDCDLEVFIPDEDAGSLPN